jgi:hypothetical protein
VACRLIQLERVECRTLTKRLRSSTGLARPSFNQSSLRAPPVPPAHRADPWSQHSGSGRPGADRAASARLLERRVWSHVDDPNPHRCPATLAPIPLGRTAHRRLRRAPATDLANQGPNGSRAFQFWTPQRAHLQSRDRFQLGESRLVRQTVAVYLHGMGIRSGSGHGLNRGR